MKPTEITAPIERELAEFEREFALEFREHPSAVAEMCSHVGTFGGKKLRPILLFLSGKAIGELNKTHAGLAIAIELLHTATLIHDDVLDEAELRRHKDTVNARWGNQRGILLGDYIFSRTFSVVGSLDGTGLVRDFAKITSIVSLGEIMQVQNRFNLGLSEETYFEIIDKKTATLFAASGRLGSHYAGGEKWAGNFEDFGKNAGRAFQIVDDLFDLFGSENRVGKTLLSDARQGKMTLPLIRMLETEGPAAKDETRKLIEEILSVDVRAKLRAMTEVSGAVEYTRKAAQKYLDMAVENLRPVPESPAKESLLLLADFILKREF
jgi:octaprenyl-diphosphate synthase